MPAGRTANELAPRKKGDAYCEGGQKLPDDYEARFDLLSNRAHVMQIHALHSNWAKNRHYSQNPARGLCARFRPRESMNRKLTHFGRRLGSATRDGKSVFLFANSKDACVFSQLMRITQLPPVGSKEIMKLSTGVVTFFTTIGTRFPRSAIRSMCSLYRAPYQLTPNGNPLLHIPDPRGFGFTFDVANVFSSRFDLQVFENVGYAHVGYQLLVGVI